MKLHTRVSIMASAVLCALVANPLTALATYEAFAETQMSERLKTSIAELSPTPQYSLPVPILLGVEVEDLNDTWGDARSAGRTHEGVDIFAPRGAYIVSPTDAVVVSVGYGSIGGNYVFTVNPGGERYYYAHLNSVAPGVERGVVLRTGDLIGYVGNTGNADAARPHLHFGIYAPQAVNPYPRIARAFTMDERLTYLARMIDASADREAIARRVVDLHRDFLSDALSAGRTLPGVIRSTLDGTPLPDPVRNEPSTTLYMGSDDGTPVAVAVPGISPETTRTDSMPEYDLERGAENEGVAWLQRHLIGARMGPAAERLARYGATGYFGAVTEDALIEYQRAAGIVPAVGYYGPVTRTYIASGQVITMQEALATQAAPKQIYPVKKTNLYIAEGKSVRGSYTNVVALGEDGAAVEVTSNAQPADVSDVDPPVALGTRDLELGASGDDVRALQQFLIRADTGPEAAYLSGYGPTGYFGTVTRAALIEYQRAHRISPALGFYGPETRAHLSNAGHTFGSGVPASAISENSASRPVKKTNLYIAEGKSVRGEYTNVVPLPAE